MTTATHRDWSVPAVTGDAPMLPSGHRGPGRSGDQESSETRPRRRALSTAWVRSVTSSFS